MDEDNFCYSTGCENIATMVFVAHDSDYGYRFDHSRSYYSLCCDEHDMTYPPGIRKFTMEEFKMWMIHNE